jgi:hypothetical protein
MAGSVSTTVALLVRVGHGALVDVRRLHLLIRGEALAALLAIFDAFLVALHVSAAATARVHVVALQHAP